MINYIDFYDISTETPYSINDLYKQLNNNIVLAKIYDYLCVGVRIIHNTEYNSKYGEINIGFDENYVETTETFATIDFQTNTIKFYDK